MYQVEEILQTVALLHVNKVFPSMYSFPTLPQKFLRTNIST